MTWPDRERAGCQDDRLGPGAGVALHGLVDHEACVVNVLRASKRPGHPAMPVMLALW
jgi:hypothetical protein